MVCVCLRFKLASQKALGFCMCLLILDGVLDGLVIFGVRYADQQRENT